MNSLYFCVLTIKTNPSVDFLIEKKADTKYPPLKKILADFCVSNMKRFSSYFTHEINAKHFLDSNLCKFRWVSFAYFS